MQSYLSLCACSLLAASHACWRAILNVFMLVGIYMAFPNGITSNISMVWQHTHAQNTGRFDATKDDNDLPSKTTGSNAISQIRHIPHMHSLASCQSSFFLCMCETWNHLCTCMEKLCETHSCQAHPSENLRYTCRSRIEFNDVLRTKYVRWTFATSASLQIICACAQ